MMGLAWLSLAATAKRRPALRRQRDAMEDLSSTLASEQVLYFETTSWARFRDALKYHHPLLHFVYADALGDLRPQRAGAIAFEVLLFMTSVSLELNLAFSDPGCGDYDDERTCEALRSDFSSVSIMIGR